MKTRSPRIRRAARHRPPARRARRRRLQPGVDRPAASATSSIGWRRGRGHARRDLRPAARVPLRRAGQHDRDAARATTRRGACRSTRSTARRASRPPRCCAASTCWSSTCRTSARASTPTSTRWPTACAPAARHGVPVIVCDRPNPIGGVDVEGAALVPGFESFVGQFPIPMRHGMTIGELARLFNEHFGIGADLEVVTMEGWRRDDVRRRDRAAVGDAVAEHADARHRDRLSGHGAVRRHECSRRGAARRGRSSWSARRGSTPSALPTR